MAATPLALLLTGLTLIGCGDKEDDTDVVNQAPIASAGSDITGGGTTRVILDGGGSYDPDGDPITWHWSFDRVPAASGLAGSTGVFLNNNTDGASGTSFLPDAAGVFVVKLTVKDDSGLSSAADYVIVEIQEGNQPQASAGADVHGEVGTAAYLDGTGSYDPLGLDLTYRWVMASAPAGSALTALDNANTATPSITPDIGGVYVAVLTVNNGFSDSAPDAAYVLVSTGDPAAPIALAGDDIEDAQDCMDLTLDGSASYDPNGDDIGYMWTLQSKPEGSDANNYTIADREAAITTFYPDISGTYTFTLAVQDGLEWSSPDTLTAVVAERFANTPPTVEAGGTVSVSGGTALCSEGSYGAWECGSCSPMTVSIGEDVRIDDAEGDATDLEWTVVDGNVSISGPTDTEETTVYISGATPEEPDACAPNDYRLQLAATDCPQETGVDELTVRVMCCGELYSPDTGR